jgi:hypothetical protein
MPQYACLNNVTNFIVASDVDHALGEPLRTP